MSGKSLSEIKSTQCIDKTTLWPRCNYVDRNSGEICNSLDGQVKRLQGAHCVCCEGKGFSQQSLKLY
jgi:hypothetical protein